MTVVLWHMGALHPYEQWLTVLVAVGPFVVLALVVLRQRRRDREEEDDPDEGGGGDAGSPGRPGNPPPVSRGSG